MGVVGSGLHFPLPCFFSRPNAVFYHLGSDGSGIFNISGNE